jgi:hypothetical protein
MKSQLPHLHLHQISLKTPDLLPTVIQMNLPVSKTAMQLQETLNLLIWGIAAVQLWIATSFMTEAISAMATEASAVALLRATEMAIVIPLPPAAHGPALRSVRGHRPATALLMGAVIRLHLGAGLAHLLLFVARLPLKNNQVADPVVALVVAVTFLQ